MTLRRLRSIDSDPYPVRIIGTSSKRNPWYTRARNYWTARLLWGHPGLHLAHPRRCLASGESCDYHVLFLHHHYTYAHALTDELFRQWVDRVIGVVFPM